MTKLRRISIVAFTLVALAGSASAQSVAQQNTAPAVRQTAPVMATDAASRVGVSRARAESPAAAAQMTTNESTKWLMILGIAAIAAVIIIAVT